MKANVLTNAYHLIFKVLFSLASGFTSNKKLSILIYHRVLDKPDPIFTVETDKKSFDWQMKLVSSIFNVIRLPEAIKHIENNSLPPRSLCITFDDGYLDNYTNALPILQSHNLKATFFIATSFQDGSIMWNDRVIEAVRNSHESRVDLSQDGLLSYRLETAEDKFKAITDIIAKIKHIDNEERLQKVEIVEQKCECKCSESLMMGPEQLTALHKAGMTIGGHTVTHPILMSIDNSSVEHEIQEGKEYLEHLLGDKIEVFAYPNGKPGLDYNDEHVEIVKRLGFIGAVSTTWGYSDNTTDRFQLKRFTPWDQTPVKFLVRLLLNMVK